jgi:hypothetical protein
MCVSSQGTLFQQTIATVLTTVALVEKVTPPQSELDIFRCKAIDAEYSSVHAAGSLEGGTADVDIWYDPMDDGHEILMAAVHNYAFSGAGSIVASARKKTWRIRFAQLFTTGLVSEPRNWVFIGVQKTFNVAIAAGEALKASMSFEVERSTTLPTAAGAA